VSLFSLLEAGIHFERLARGYPNACHQALELAARVVEAEAKRLIGGYEAKPRWPELTEATQADRVAHGYSANQPLLRSGELRDSIQHCSSPHEARVGSNLDRAVWHEMGTSRVPPRSFLASALHAKEKLIVRAIGETVRDYITSVNLDMEFIHLAIRAFEKILHSLHELGAELTSGGESDKRRRR
jgi:phage gpG-like protein